jgi:hypothetical protein
VIIVLGGTSSITLNNTTAFELFTRTPLVPDGSTTGVSLVTVPSVPPVNYKPWTGSSFLTVSSSATEVAIHGLVYAPEAPVTVFARPTAPLLGGVVASKLRLRANAGATGSLMGVAADGRRTLVLTSTAASPAASGEIAITEQAVVKVANDPARTATVRSWRAL